MTRTIVLTLTMPTNPPPPEPGGFQRLRRLLKALIRSYGLRCVDIAETKPNEQTAAPESEP
jgi:hypothetical protein